MAEELKSDKERIIQRCIKETALPEVRFNGEFQRTLNQIELFSGVLDEGSWKDLRIDVGNPKRTPIPKSDIRHMLIPLGPVAVFGASNFPLAFSVAGGDTIAVLAAGCSVVFKAHPAHTGTSVMVAECIGRAIAKTGLHRGVFAMINGMSNEVGGMVVKHPLVKAVGFTGSYDGGKALLDIANRREGPIPVFAEMGSTNAVFVLPEILKQKGGDIAKGLANSLTLGVGQFCTNPGMAFIIRSKEADNFISSLKTSVENSVCWSMLTSGIQSAYLKGLAKTKDKRELTWSRKVKVMVAT
ncbi:aldehyde dehydrogenase family protein [Arenibacter sp. S6351L]|nr:aldehyde dehydrogenase family protein [Arenibacter sp. S6351L]